MLLHHNTVLPQTIHITVIILLYHPSKDTLRVVGLGEEIVKGLRAPVVTEGGQGNHDGGVIPPVGVGLGGIGEYLIGIWLLLIIMPFTTIPDLG